MKLNKSLLGLIVLFIAGFGLRAYQFQSYPLGFDQVILLENAQQIVSGHPVLIGPKTGYANVFIGPLTYYLTAAALLLTHSPYALVLYQLALVAMTMLALMMYSFRYLDKSLRWIVVAVWIFSPLILGIDRLPWNPSLLNLASILTFFPLFAKKRFSWFEWISIAAGCFLGFQSHFTGVFLPLLVILITLKSKLPGVWLLRISAILGFALSWSPLLVFDLRHQFMNLRGLHSLLLDGNSSGSLVSLLLNILRSGQTTIENAGKILFVNTNAPLFMIAGITIVLIALVQWYLHRSRTLFLSFLWVGLIALFFGFYSGPRPEYYYMVQFPAFVVLIAQLITLIRSDLVKSLGIGAFAAYVWLFTLMYASLPSFNIKNLLAISSYVHQVQAQSGIQSLSLDMSLADREGIQYLLRDISPTERGKKIHITYPDKIPYSNTIYFEGMSVWEDPRQPNQSLSEPEYIVLFPPPLALYKASSNSEPFGKPFHYVVFAGDVRLGDIYVIDKKTSEKDWQAIVTACDGPPCYAQWPAMTLFDKAGYVHQFRETGFFFVPTSPADIDPTLLNQISIY